MHESVMDWGKRIIEERGLADKSVLEVGSINVNGSLRELFHGAYLGVDLRSGPGVDAVVSGNKMPYAKESFDVVVCTETLSHDIAFWETLAEMHRVLKREGTLLLSVRGYGFGHNDSPCDFYRFTKQAVDFWMIRLGYWEWHLEDDPQYSGVLAWAQK